MSKTETKAQRTKREKAETAKQEAESKTATRSAAETLRKYRVKYVHTDGYAGLSINNGDNIADQLKMCEPQRVVRIAEAVLPGIKAGELSTRYAKLNPGMQRMNCGNRIRSAVKNGTITNAALKKAIAATS
jgi:hypothetical protein